MTEHKFGTWYPVEELKEICREVLFWDRGKIELGWKSRNMDGKILYRAERKVIHPTHFMPLPPPPGETND